MFLGHLERDLKCDICIQHFHCRQSNQFREEGSCSLVKGCQSASETDHWNMAAKEAASLLPTSTTSVKDAKAEKGRFPIKVAFQWLHITTTALIVCWLAFLTHSCIRQEAPQSALTSDVTRQLMTSQEVRGSSGIGSSLNQTPRFAEEGSWEADKGSLKMRLWFVTAAPPAQTQLKTRPLPTRIDCGRVGWSSTSSTTPSPNRTELSSWKR